MAQEGKAPLPMQEATSAPQGGGPKAANPAAMTQGLAAPSGPAPRPGAVDPRDEAVKEVSAKMQAKQTPPPSAAPQLITDQGAPALMQPPMPAQAPAMNPMMQPPMATPVAPSQEVPMMAKGGMPEDGDNKGLAVMIGLGAPSYEEAAEGNPPPGATKEEVADDQLVLLSEGELVVPANVVRYHGLGTYEGMRREALMGLQGMEQNGQIEYVSGGKEKADPIDDDGGLVKAQAGTTLMGAANNRSTLGPGIGQPGIMPTAASQQFVKTPTTGGMMKQTDTTPLVLDGKPYTPTTDLTSIYAPEQDYDAGGPEECQEGYQYNYVTQKCEKIPTPDPVPDPVPQQTSQQSGEPQSDDRDPDPYNIGGGRTVLGGTTYGIGYQSSDASAGYTGLIGGLAQGLLGKNDQVIFTDPDTGRTATMSRARYDVMKEDRNNPNTAAYINNLMDIQEGINNDYRNQKGYAGRGSGFVSDLMSPGARNFDQNNAAKKIAQEYNIEYTGQSLAEMVVESNRIDADSAPTLPDELAYKQGMSGGAATPTSGATTPTSGATTSTSMDLRPIDVMGLRGTTTAQLNEKSGLLLGDSGYDPILDEAGGGFRATIGDKTKNEMIAAVNSGIYGRQDLSRIAQGESYERRRLGPDGQPVSGDQAMLQVTQYSDPIRRRIEQQAAREALYDLSYDDSGMATNEQMSSIGFKNQTERRSAQADVAARETQRREDAQAYRPGTAYPEKEDRTVKQNKQIADAEAKQQMRDQGKDEDTVRRTSAVTDSKGNPVRQGGTGPGAGSVVTNTSPKEEKSGGKIVCTEMYRQTQLEDWSRTMKIWDTYQKRYLTPIHEVGYHWLFKPYVRGMQNSGILTNVGAFFAQKRTQHLKHVLTKGRAKDSFVGNVWCKIIHPIVYLIGKMVYKK